MTKTCAACGGSGLMTYYLPAETIKPCHVCQKPSKLPGVSEPNAKAEYEAYARGYADGLKEGEAAKKDRQKLLAEIGRIYEIVKRCERPW